MVALRSVKALTFAVKRFFKVRMIKVRGKLVGGESVRNALGTRLDPDSSCRAVPSYLGVSSAMIQLNPRKFTCFNLISYALPCGKGIDAVSEFLNSLYETK